MKNLCNPKTIIKIIFKLIKRKLKSITELLFYLPELFSPKGYIYVYISSKYYQKHNGNWGDDLNLTLLEFISGKKIIHARCRLINSEYYLCIGSILQWFGNKNAIVWGSGLIGPLQVNPCKKFLAVRGPLTRQELIKQGFECPEIYGDPALLLPRYYNPPINKIYKIGLICHYTECENPVILRLIEKYSLLFIDIKNYGHWNNFVDKVLSCEYIISSSLHGLIISDAYNIPNLWCQFTDSNSEYNHFKFKDYYLSIGKDITDLNGLPFRFDKEITMDEIIALINSKWSSPKIDLDQLLSVCPFKKM